MPPTPLPAGCVPAPAFDLAHSIRHYPPSGVNSLLHGDPDGDQLANITECRLGTDPANADSDGDRVNDDEEVAAGSSPIDPGSRPPAVPVLRVGARSMGFSWRTDEVGESPPEPVLTWVTQGYGNLVLAVRGGP